MTSMNGSNMQYRIEKDSMGEMRVPVDAYYGASTQRAVENFPISDLRFPRAFIRAMGIIKSSSALVNAKLGLLDEDRARLIIKAAEEVERGDLDGHFVLDIFQTGSGTSTNMNANEVIANRAKELAEGKLSFHPNDHINICQSSNDVIPAAMHVSAASEIRNLLLPSLELLATALQKKAVEYDSIIKTGRTHLQDATPIRLGQEFGGYESQIRHGIARLNRSLVTLLELPLGGTAVGTGLNTNINFSNLVIKEISKRTGIEFVEAGNHFEAQSAKDAIVEVSGQLKTVACSLAKIAGDIRLLGCGPRCGFGEIRLPEVQPGSSIMPGKVNPVIAESVLMAVAQVIGNDTTITLCNHSGSLFELNVMMPIMIYNLLQSINILAASAKNFSERCVDGLKPNTKRLNELAEASIAICTALAPRIGYDKAAKLAKEAFETGEPLRVVALKHKVLPEDELNALLDLASMTKPGL